VSISLYKILFFSNLRIDYFLSMLFQVEQFPIPKPGLVFDFGVGVIVVEQNESIEGQHKLVTSN
jgi:hypothetical protein